jgi:hypothetical protein
MSRRTVYEIRDEASCALSWHPSRREAEAEQRWWTKHGGAETTIHEHEYDNTRKGVANLLAKVATNA